MNSNTRKRNADKALRQGVLARDEKCVNCGSYESLECAHYIARSQGGLAIKENLVILCRTCHHALDNGNNHYIASCIRASVKHYLDQLYPSFEGRSERNRWDP